MNTTDLQSTDLRSSRSVARHRPGVRALRRVVLALCALTLPMSSPAHAAAWCEGKVVRMLASKGGEVQLLTEFRGEWLSICNMEVTWKDVPPTTCASWVATLTSAILTQNIVTMFYTDPITVCSTIPAYVNAPPPHYVALAR